METEEILKKGLSLLGLKINLAKQKKLLGFLNLLSKWNKTYSLTKITNPQEMVIKHILDSLAVAPYISADTILDLGTGAGLPGIVLAIIFPEKNFVLLDSNSKKTRFLEYVKLQLNLTNVTVVTSRVQDYKVTEKFSCIITRAVGSIEDIIKNSKHLLAKDGRFLFMKGQVPSKVPVKCEVHQLKVPFLEAKRCLVVDFQPLLCFNEL